MDNIDMRSSEFKRDYLDEQREMDIRTGITVLQQMVHKTAVDHGWWEAGDRNMGEMIALMHSELSEGLESERNREPYLWYRYDQDPTGVGRDNPGPLEIDGITALGKPEGLASEFADTIIRICDTCERLGIPLAEALIRKSAYNETRPYRHGGKAS